MNTKTLSLFLFCCLLPTLYGSLTHKDVRLIRERISDEHNKALDEVYNNQGYCLASAKEYLLEHGLYRDVIVKCPHRSTKVKNYYNNERLPHWEKMAYKLLVQGAPPEWANNLTLTYVESLQIPYCYLRKNPTLSENYAEEEDLKALKWRDSELNLKGILSLENGWRVLAGMVLLDEYTTDVIKESIDMVYISQRDCCVCYSYDHNCQLIYINEEWKYREELERVMKKKMYETIREHLAKSTCRVRLQILHAIQYEKKKKELG